MDGIKDLWQNHKALFITAIIALVAILVYVYSQNKGNGVGSAVAPNTPNAETPTVESEQLSTILADLGKLTPVTNTLQPINTVTNNTTTITNPVSMMPTPTMTTTLTTPPVTITHTTNTGISGIGNDTARDAAIRAAEKKYHGPSQAAALQQAIAAIQKQYPRSGPTT